MTFVYFLYLDAKIFWKTSYTEKKLHYGMQLFTIVLNAM